MDHSRYHLWICVRGMPQWWCQLKHVLFQMYGDSTITVEYTLIHWGVFHANRFKESWKCKTCFNPTCTLCLVYGSRTGRCHCFFTWTIATTWIFQQVYCTLLQPYYSRVLCSQKRPEYTSTYSLQIRHRTAGLVRHSVLEWKQRWRCPQSSDTDCRLRTASVPPHDSTMSTPASPSTDVLSTVCGRRYSVLGRFCFIRRSLSMI